MPGLIGPDGFRRVAEAALALPGVDGVEVLFMHEWGGLTRFARSEIHQSAWREDTGLHVRVVTKDRVGVAASNDFSPEGARRAAESAREMAEVIAPDPLWPGLAGPAEPASRNGFDDATADATPARRADGVAALIGRCAKGFTAAGAYETQAVEVGVANTEGQLCWAPSSQASLTTVVGGNEGGSGFAEAFSGRVEDLDPEAIGGRASDKAVASRNPKPLDPGDYVVVLEPAAVSTLVGFLAFVGFGGRYLIENRSCLSGKQGSKVAAEAISIWDDGTDPHTLGVPFDFEGVPRRRVDLVKDGVFLDGVYDLRTAKEAGRETTGHGLPAPNPESPFPLNLFLATGEASVEDMVAATERGVLVTRFHYSNVVNAVESSITGMTRDGTFLIEHGEIAGPVMNFRFTQSILDALTEVSMIGREAELASEFFFSASRVPALKIERFRFSGRSDH
ncbi:MAG: TldD/PmbA family protein [Actinobacteria bacterium]|nr:TldD/PmbA family protein [Actinomycetota bacterium]